MSTDKIIEPHHRWAANEDADVRAFGLKDRCLICGVHRYDPMPGERAIRRNAVAAGPCPQKPWTEMPESEVEAAVAAYLDEPSTPSERAIYNELHQGEDTP